ncbi:cilia- and flagella-associated protein 52 [Scaptodrosophila lebanonensis]|uniref:Cilia- and flagella-associated protein 52 n=1 Tax=Drosophila lebanonensis TaxID=7225 RepID=A0A6J2TBB6_DROLE|nr:cilia- and flagella-associated protein 52 [Scaptodrosophila lebanonensis]
MAEPTPHEIAKLHPRTIFGINGKVANGLRQHPDNQHSIFALGNKIAIWDFKKNTQEFMSGHTNSISCLDLSKSGKYIASGQVNHMGFRGYVILWDFAQRRELSRHDLHKVHVQAICFTAEDRFVVSIGGKDDGTVIVFDVESFSAICRQTASRSISGNALTVRPLHKNPYFFITAGDRHLRLWSILRDQKKLHVQDVHVGNKSRVFYCARVEKNDEYAYLGTGTGDIVKIVLSCCDRDNVSRPGTSSCILGAFGTHNPRKPTGRDCNRYVNGVRALYLLEGGKLLVGAGDGVVELVVQRTDVPLVHYREYPGPTWPFLRTLKSTRVSGSVTSLVRATADKFYICTDTNEIYQLMISTWVLKLLRTCHTKSVYCITFPKNYAAVFATSGRECIRIWSASRKQELLRIMVYNFNCAAIRFTQDGTSIISVWNDGIIRAFTPITGRLIYCIPNAHNKGCSALAVSSNGRMIVTGGIEGQVRVWKIDPYRQDLLGVLKDHSGPITTLDMNCMDTEVISACTDGSCVIWDVTRLTRKQVVTANTQFMAAVYFPSGVQVLTCGSDGRISYWMTFNGAMIRELTASNKSSVNCVSINSTGDYFISVGSDLQVKLWNYNSGEIVGIGSEHASSVISSAFSPCGQMFVTGSTDGSLIIWDVPKEFWGKPNPPDGPQFAFKSKTPSKSKLNDVPSRVDSGTKQAPPKLENIDGLLKATPKDDICCVECPPCAKKEAKGSDSFSECRVVTDPKKC